jgi:hypothetical protein
MRVARLTAILALAALAAGASAQTAGETKPKATLKTIAAKSPAQPVQVLPDPDRRRVDIVINSELFTSYRYPTNLKKPVLYPLAMADGTVITRNFPPKAGERADHPHHVGLWFNYGDVDGIDFWNNSDAIKPEDRPHMGTIEHRKVVSAKSGADRGELEVETEWLGPDGKPMLNEHTKFIFRGTADSRSIDRITTLIALDKPVKFPDNKEGVIGMRVARSLELPSKKAETFTDSTGRAITVAAMDNSVVTGNYLTSEGKTGDDAWGTRGRWCVLTGKVNQEPVSIAILDDPQNPGYPTYWHARGYGLFAANPLGQKALSDGKETLNFALAAHQSVTFRHRILILSKTATTDDVENAWQDFTRTPQSTSSKTVKAKK